MVQKYNNTILGSIAKLLSAPEQGLRLLLSLLVVYPLFYLHRKYFRSRNETFQHIFFVVCGLSLMVFNYGFHVIHSLVCVFVAWLLLKTIGGSVASVIVSLTFQMGYLVIGYYITATENYDIKWTMPQCVLTLRLIALTFDLYDGVSKPETLSSDQKQSSLGVCPSLLEVLAHSYFPASFLVGPQFSLKRYLAWVRGTLYPPDTPSPETSGLLRGLGGLVYLGIYQIGSNYLPDSYILSKSYMALNLWQRLVVVGIWGKITLYKYISCWLITEGACIMSGIAYSGKDSENKPQWKGCANVQVRMYEFGGKFTFLIKSFNTNTNNWLMYYVYKRLKFLNNKNLSQVGALVFLAIWHGLHSGYYMCFFLEFLVVSMERSLGSILGKYPKLVAFFNTGPMTYVTFAVLKVYAIVFMGYCLGSFILLSSSRWWEFYSSLYFCGHFLFGGVIVYGPLLKIILRYLFGPPEKRQAVDDTSSDLHKSTNVQSSKKEQ